MFIINVKIIFKHLIKFEETKEEVKEESPATFTRFLGTTNSLFTCQGPEA